MRQTKIVRLLIDKSADMNAKDMFGMTALMHAAERGHNDVVKLLIDESTDVNAKDNRGRTALSIAREEEYDNTVDVLRAAGAKV